jgi:hypothetical protein
VELTILWSSRFQDWYDKRFATPNYHGIYNGQNLLGLDLGALYLGLQRDPGLSLARFIGETEWCFEIQVPGDAELEILQRYPWLTQGVQPVPKAVSWKIRFSAWGFPLVAEGSDQSVAVSRVVAVRPDRVPLPYRTRGLLSGSDDKPALTAAGLSFVQLSCGLRE